MADPQSLPPDTELNVLMANLRGLTYSGPAVHDQHLVQGVFFSLDPAAVNTVTVDSVPGQLMKIGLAVERPGRWLTLNIGMGPAEFSHSTLVGFACKSRGAKPVSLRVSLRSGIEGSHSDAFFSKTVMTFPETSVHLDVLELAANPDIPAKAIWREIVIFFESETQEIDLQDFRLIVI